MNSTEKLKPSKLFFFIERTRITLLLIIGVVLFGIFSLTALDIESAPEINQPVGIVQTIYPNSSPADVETNVTSILEEEISGLAQLKDLTSTSTNNVSTIVVSFDSRAEPKEVLDNLRTAVSNVSPNLPSDVESPRVIELDFNNQSIVTYSVSSSNKSTLELSAIADEIAKRINRISGVSKTELVGEVEEKVNVVLDTSKMETFGIGLSEVVNTLNSTNLNLPLGSIDKNSEELSLRLIGRLNNLDELSRVPLRSQAINNTPSFLTLSDIAEIRLEPELQKTESLVSQNGSMPINSISINVFKSRGGNIINIVDSIDATVDELALSFGSEIEIVKTNDNAFFIRSDIRTLSRNGIQTIIIIFFALMLFLTAREAFVAAIAIPTIFLSTFAVIYFTGQTISGLTIFSLILSLGLIVDTSIVIVEGVHDYKNEGYSNTEAAKKSLQTFYKPLISGNLTTLSAFAPMLLVGGIVGEFIKTIPIVLSITLLCSIFVSFVFTPLIASKILKKTDLEKQKTRKQEIINNLKTRYKVHLKSVLKSRILKVGIVLGTLVMFVFSMFLPISGVLRAQLFPVADVPFIYINFEAPTGTPLEETKNLSEQLISEFQNNPYIKNFVLNLGTKIDTSGISIGGNVRSNYGHAILNLTDNVKERPKSYEIATTLRQNLVEINGLDITVEELSAGPPTSDPLDIQIIGPDMETLKDISFRLRAELSQISGLVNISTDFDNLSDEINITLDQDRLRFFGLTNQQVALSIQAFTTGIDVGKLEIDSNEFDIKMFLDDVDSKSVAELENLLIRSQLGDIPLNYIAQITTSESVQFIPRINQERSARITGAVGDGFIFSEIKPTIDDLILNFELPEEYRFNLEGEDADIQESFRQLFSSMIIAVLLILTILVLQFNSFRQTALILFTIPLAVIGIFPGLALLGLPLSFPAFLGVVMLAGIVVNDAIVMMDQININRENGLSVQDALVEGCGSRLVPILLTTITTVLGLLPISLSDEFWRGLGFSVIFGLFAATFLTLVVIPILYSFVYRDKKKDIEDNQELVSVNSPARFI